MAKIKGRPPVSAKAPAAARVPALTRTDSQLQRIGTLITEAHQAHRLGDVQRLSDVLRELAAAIDPRSGLDRAGSGGAAGVLDRAAGKARGQRGSQAGFESPAGPHAPRLPRNSDKGPPTVGTPASPRDWAKGARGYDPARPAGESHGYAHNEKDPETGTVSNTTFYRREDGSYSGFLQVNDHTDGSQTYVTGRVELDGSVNVTYVQVDANGDKTTAETIHIPPGAIDRTQDRDAGGVDPAAAKLGRHFDHSAKRGAPVVTHVNPGDAPDATSSAPKIKPGPGLVTDPRDHELPLDQATADKLKGTFRRPDPGPDPGPPDR